MRDAYLFSHDPTMDRFDYILDTYILPSSEREINIDYKMRNELISLRPERGALTSDQVMINEHTFDRAFAEISKLMKDTVATFKKGEVARKYLQHLKLQQTQSLTTMGVVDLHELKALAYQVAGARRKNSCAVVFVH